MGKQVHYDGEKYDVTGDEQVATFKNRVDFPEGDLLTYLGDEMDAPHALDDDDSMEKVPDGATISAQPPGDEIFG